MKNDKKSPILGYVIICLVIFFLVLIVLNFFYYENPNGGFFIILGSIINWIFPKRWDNFQSFYNQIIEPNKITIEFVITLVFGALIGSLFEYSVLTSMQTISRKIKKRRRRKLIQRRTADYYRTRIGENIQTDWYSYAGGLMPIVPGYVTTHYDEEHIKLDDTLQELVYETENFLKNKENQEYSGKRFSLRKVDVSVKKNEIDDRYDDYEVDKVDLYFQDTTYAAYRAITKRLDEPNLITGHNGELTTIREEYYQMFCPFHINNSIIHSFGLNILIISNEEEVILTKRSSRVAGRSGLWLASFSEGMEKDDNHRKGLIFTNTAVRGIQQEMGIFFEEGKYSISDIHYVSLGVLLNTCEPALLGYVKVDLNSEIIKSRVISKSKSGRREFEKVQSIPFTIHGIENFINDDIEKPVFAHHSLVNLYWSLIHFRNFGIKEINDFDKRLSNMYKKRKFLEEVCFTKIVPD